MHVDLYDNDVRITYDTSILKTESQENFCYLKEENPINGNTKYDL